MKWYAKYTGYLKSHFCFSDNLAWKKLWEKPLMDYIGIVAM